MVHPLRRKIRRASGSGRLILLSRATMEISPNHRLGAFDAATGEPSLEPSTTWTGAPGASPPHATSLHSKLLPCPKTHLAASPPKNIRSCQLCFVLPGPRKPRHSALLKAPSQSQPGALHLHWPSNSSFQRTRLWRSTPRDQQLGDPGLTKQLRHDVARLFQSRCLS